MDELEKIFDGILCLCAEGIEFMTRTELADAIIKEANKGIKICRAQREDSANGLRQKTPNLETVVLNAKIRTGRR